MAQPQPVIIYNHNKPEKWWSEPAEVQQPHKDSGRDDRWKGKGRAQPDSDDSDEAPEPHTESHERRELRVMNPGPRDVDNQRRKSRDPFQSDDYPSSSPQDQHPAKAEPLRMHRNVAKKGKRFQSDTDSESVAPAPMRSPDLSAMKIPRPNHKYVASVRSIVSVLSLDEDDNARRDTYPEQSLVKHGDLRSKIGEEHGLYMSADGKLIDTNIWQEKARQPETVFVNPAANREWIEDYVENRVDYNVRATFLYEEDSAVHCHSDVNTFSGKLLKPTQYDYTVPDYIKSVAMDRQMNCSANLFCQIRAGKGNKGNGRSNNSVGPPPPPPPGWVETPAPVSTTASPEATVQKPGQIVVRARADSDTNPFAPRIPCHLRPAKMEHMPGVQSIYNWEVLHGLQATDTEPLSLADWQGILHKSHEEKLPFIVVIGGPYQYQVRDKSYEGTTEQSAQLPITGKVLAFGFLTIRQPGLTGSFNGTSRMSAKAHVFVHPAYRRQKLGHVCFDKLLSTVSTRYSTKLGYDFINVTDNPTYKYPWQHDRKLYSIFVEYLVPRTRADINSRFEPDEKDLKLFAKALKDRYGFWNVGTLQAAHRSRVTYEPAPIWLDLVMFEHMCQEGLGFTRTL
ncbi:hypothetical protein CONLIGDRAFT_711004 [Coniochaeta ligniaria NRRL 30616]|uniref:N-acetyltransferase domain-containing protein n=1 Tax=Coniochaeta ligniaria NRRL 30616 TaxID=1408157 RepID=A0A1J7JI37_9PEZI|nr:hypothetical protein CONLIGDRAFT_711004 [Coniochaeta ligniaria NRRL 30616]